MSEAEVIGELVRRLSIVEEELARVQTYITTPYNVVTVSYDPPTNPNASDLWVSTSTTAAPYATDTLYRYGSGGINGWNAIA